VTDIVVSRSRLGLVILSGLPGVGKTTVARELAAAVSAVHVRIDSIEQALRDAGTDVYDHGYRVAYAVAADNLRLGRTVVADCVNPWTVTRREWQAHAVSVELVCSDVEEHKRRVESRSPDIANHRLPTWSEVMAHDYRPWDSNRLVIDTARLDVPQCVQAIVSALAS
jgi:predicted kinase